MIDYQKLYTTLFNSLTDAIEEMDTHNFGNAKKIIIKAQQDAEQMYLAQSDDEEVDE